MPNSPNPSIRGLISASCSSVRFLAELTSAGPNSDISFSAATGSDLLSALICCILSVRFVPAFASNTLNAANKSLPASVLNATLSNIAFCIALFTPWLNPDADNSLAVFCIWSTNP